MYTLLQTYREKGMDNICFDGAQRLVPNHHKDLLLLFKVNKISKPRFFGKSVKKKKGSEQGNTIQTNITEIMHESSIYVGIMLHDITYKTYFSLLQCD